MSTHFDLDNSELGKKSAYTTEYAPELLFPIPRSLKREEIKVSKKLPFYGYDIWNAYELSWLNPKGKPEVAIAQFIIPCDSTYLIDSKSFKLYLNSYNNTHFDSVDEITAQLSHDLSQATATTVTVHLFPLSEPIPFKLGSLSGKCLDHLDIEMDTFELDPSVLSVDSHQVQETLYSNLLKSNCLVTGQPDWGSITIHYEGKAINHEALLKYLVSFRNHNEFHEQCVERIYMDIMRHCKPTQLLVDARYTRRGGLDINPCRSSTPLAGQPCYLRLIRQ
jgi:7-cyano-7-deazaguanine reductase